MAKPARPSLEQFAAEVVDSRKARWADSLPEDVQAQLIDSDASIAVCVRWLKALGYDDATASKVDTWRRAKRDERRRQPG